MIRVFPRRTKWTPDDPLAFVGDPPLIGRPPEQSVYVSVTFTWDIVEGKRLQRAWSTYYSIVRIGGPAFGDPGNVFAPGQFLKEGTTITSRGCPHNCPWCHVPKREGKIREYSFPDGHIVQDNNLLACSPYHISWVFEMLRRQKHAAIFKGGLDARFLEPLHVDLLKSIRIREIWVACDAWAATPCLEKAADLLSDFRQDVKRCYAMIGWNGESIYDAETRLEWIYKQGFLPFSQLYQDDERKPYPKEWRDLNRKWSRAAAYRSKGKASETL